MENRDDKLITDFFGKNKTEIQNDGFSGRVMNRLPEKQRKTGWIVPLFALMGVIISASVIDIREIFISAFDVLMDIHLYYLLALVMLFPIITLVVYLFWEKNQTTSFKF